MRKILATGLLTALVAVLMASPALAQETFGSRLNSIVSEVWGPFFLLIAMGSGIVGIWLAVKGLMKLVETASGGRDGYGSGLTHIVVAAILIALPDAAGIGMTSVFGQARGNGALGSAGLDYNDNGMSGDYLGSIIGAVGGLGMGSPENCLNASHPAACMAGNLAQHSIPMAMFALFALTFVAGFGIFAMAIIGYARNSEHKAPGSNGLAAKLIVAVLLMNAPFAFNMATATILGTADTPIGSAGLNAGSSMLTYSGNSSIEVIKRYGELIAHSFVILAFFGAFAFVRGILMMKSVAETGGQRGSYGAASVHMVAGILLGNAKATSCFALNSFGGAGLASGFCTF